MKDVLIIVDVQNDFVPGGALQVTKGNEVVPIINKLQNCFKLVLATQDWHPKNHKSFASVHGKNPGEVMNFHGIKQILWPDHCIQNTFGAQFVKELNTSKITKVFKKGTSIEVDSYSGFFNNDHKSSTGLEKYLKDNDVSNVFITGLATDYCVKYTALDAVLIGFNTYVIEDATRGVNLKPSDVNEAMNEMKDSGVIVINSVEVI